MVLDKVGIETRDAFDGFLEECELQSTIQGASGKDPFIAAASIALREMNKDPEFAAQTIQSIRSKVERGRPQLPSHRHGFAVRELAHGLRGKYSYFPLHESMDFTDPDAWISNSWEYVKTHEFRSIDQVMTLMSVVRNRGASLALAINAFKNNPEGRFEDPVNVVVPGCSRLIDIKSIQRKLSFSEISVHDPVDINYLSATHTQGINSFINHPVSLGHIIGVDVMRLKDPLAKAWAETCSFYPKERLPSPEDVRRGEKINEEVKIYRYLDELDIPNFHFLWGDYGHPFIDEEFAKLPGIDYDAVFISTMGYQVPKENLRNMLERSKRLVSERKDPKRPKGIVIIQDFIDLENSDLMTGELTFREHWHEKRFGYITLVLDMEEPEKGFQVIAQWFNGRCAELYLPVGSAALTLAENKLWTP